MNKEKYIFAQLISFLNEDKFRRIVSKYQGILSISLTDKTHIKDLFNKTNFQYGKERCDSNKPSVMSM
jgi:hypothetical protein